MIECEELDMAELGRTINNLYNQDKWIQPKQELLSQQLTRVSTWFTQGNLEKLGCDLQADLELTGKKDIPFEFVDIGELDI